MDSIPLLHSYSSSELPMATSASPLSNQSINSQVFIRYQSIVINPAMAGEGGCAERMEDVVHDLEEFTVHNGSQNTPKHLKII